MELLEKMELIAPEYIEEAQLPLPQKKIHWGYYAALAASIVLAVVAGGFFLGGRRASVPGVHDYYGDGAASVINVIISNDKDAAAKEFGDKKVSYQTVSGGSLKVGSGDNVKTAYLHYTKSAEAGNPLMAIHLMSEDTNSVEKFGQVMPLPTSVSAGQMMRIMRSRDFCCIRARGFPLSGSRQRESSITVSVIR